MVLLQHVVQNNWQLVSRQAGSTIRQMVVILAGTIDIYQQNARIHATSAVLSLFEKAIVKECAEKGLMEGLNEKMLKNAAQEVVGIVHTCLKQLIDQQHSSKNYGPIIHRFLLAFPSLAQYPFHNYLHGMAAGKQKDDYSNALHALLTNW